MIKKLSLTGLALAIAMAANLAHAGSFANGGFEDGTSNGWITGEGYRGDTFNSTLTTGQLLPAGSLYTGPATRSAIIAAGASDPNVGALLGSTVFSGNFSYRAEDTVLGGNASAISQQVLNYTDPSIFFAWKAVLENGGHTQDESAEMIITLVDDTTGATLVNRVYNAGIGGGGVDTRFGVDGGFFYTADWQIEELAIDAALSGHDFTLSLLAADCQPTGHAGYVYLDGFGATTPDPDPIPEPPTLALFGIGAACFGFMRRSRKA